MFTKESFFLCRNKAHLKELIDKFPKVFYSIIEEFEKGNLEQKYIAVPGTTEQIKFENLNNKIKVQFFHSVEKNFSSHFQNYVHEIYNEINDEENIEKIISRKSLMDRSLNKNTVKKIEKSVKDYQYPL